MLMENVKHVSFAKQVLCVSEIRHSLLATSAQSPGISTLIASLASFSQHADLNEDDTKHDVANAYEASVSNEFYEAGCARDKKRTRGKRRQRGATRCWFHLECGHIAELPLSNL